MIRKWTWLHLLFVAIFSVIPLLHCTGDTGTGTTADSGSLMGTLREPGGAQPADSVLVKIFNAGALEGRPVAVAVTDKQGSFNIDGLSDGYYSLQAEAGTNVLFHDSLIVTIDHPVSIDDTLACSSTLSGFVGMQPGDDPRTITLHLAGTGKSRTIDNPEGKFTVTGLAPGIYTLQLASTLPEYLPTTSTVRIAGCTAPVSVDSFRIIYTGIPSVPGVRITQDTATGIIKISWKKCPYPDLRDYVLYRDTSVSGNPPYTLFGATRDTVYADTIFRSLKPAPSDSTVRRCRYRIALRDNGEHIGPTPQTTELLFQPKSLVTTFFTHQILNKTENQQGYRQGDTLLIALSAYNRTRPLHRLAWYDAAERDSFAINSSILPSARELTGSVRFVFRQSVNDTLMAVVSGQTGDRWIDTIVLSTINDVPYVNAGQDTGVFLGDNICLHGSVSQRVGFITKWEWKIGPEAWTVAGPDLCIKAPLSESMLLCSLAVTDDFGNRGTGAKIIVSSTKVRSMRAGATFTLILKIDGTLWGCGDNNEFALKDTTLSRITNPVRLLEDVEEMAQGYNSVLMLQSDGTLWGRGNNFYGQLGTNAAPVVRTTTPTMTGVAHIATAAAHSFFIKIDGSLWACGANEYGQLGDGTMTTRTTPVEIMNDVSKVSTSELHTLILKTDGTLWACGFNSAGQLGDGTRKLRAKPIAVMSGVQDIAAGILHSLILKKDSTLWVCGDNSNGVLGDATQTSLAIPEMVMEHITKISTSPNHSLVMFASDSVWGFGYGGSGQLGTSGSDFLNAPVPITDEVTDISAGDGYSLFLKRDGTLWGCGNNSMGQLSNTMSNSGIMRVVPPEHPYWFE